MSKFSSHNSRSAKLTAADVVDIRQRIADGETQSSICKDYPISIGQLGRIARNESWKIASSIPVKDIDIKESQQRLLAMMGRRDETASPGLDRLEEELRKTETKADKLLGELLK